MRGSILLLVLLTAACASSGTSSTTATTVERRTTSFSYIGPDGNVVTVDVEARAALQTRSAAIAASREEVWRALPQAYADLSIPLAALDSVQFVLGNPGLAVNSGRLGRQRISRYLNCGTDPLGGQLADRYTVRLNVVSRVRSAPDGAILDTQVLGDAAQRGVAGVAVACSSTGQLEDALANAVRLRLAGVVPEP